MLKRIGVLLRYSEGKTSEQFNGSVLPGPYQAGVSRGFGYIGIQRCYCGRGKCILRHCKQSYFCNVVQVKTMGEDPDGLQHDVIAPEVEWR